MAENKCFNLGARASSLDNFYVGKKIFFTLRDGSRFEATIVSYDGTTKVAVVDRNLPNVPLDSLCPETSSSSGGSGGSSSTSSSSSSSAESSGSSSSSSSSSSLENSSSSSSSSSSVAGSSSSSGGNAPEDFACSGAEACAASGPIGVGCGNPENSNGVCCFTCTTTISMEFDTFDLDAGASGQTFYDVALDFHSRASGQTIYLKNSGRQVFTDENTRRFRATGKISYIDSTYAYWWRMEAGFEQNECNVSVSGPIYFNFIVNVQRTLKASYSIGDEPPCSGTPVEFFWSGSQTPNLTDPGNPVFSSNCCTADGIPLNMHVTANPYWNESYFSASTPLILTASSFSGSGRQCSPSEYAATCSVSSSSCGAFTGITLSYSTSTFSYDYTDFILDEGTGNTTEVTISIAPSVKSSGGDEITGQCIWTLSISTNVYDGDFNLIDSCSTSGTKETGLGTPAGTYSDGTVVTVP